jgi:transposase
MRCGFDRLAERVQTVMGESPMSGHWFLFRSRCGSRLKLLVWDRDGFVLYYKRLEAGVFKLPKLAPGTRSVELKASELAMLLEGIDLSKLKRTPRYQHPSAAAASSEKTNDESVTPLYQKHPH